MQRLITVLLWVGFIGSVLFLTHSTYRYVFRVETQATAKIDTDGFSRIWFSPNGELVAIRTAPEALNIRIWAAPSGPALRDNNLAWDAGGDPIFTVMEDASKVAWVHGPAIRVVSLTAPAQGAPVDRPVTRKAPPIALAFNVSGALAVLYADGELQLLDAAGEKVSAATHLELPGPAHLLASGQYLAAYTPSHGDAFVFDTRAGDQLLLMEYKKYSANFLSATLSPMARFAVGTTDQVEEQGDSIGAPGPVRALAYLDRSRVIAAGDFPGIYLLESGHGPHEIEHAQAGSNTVAVSDLFLAFGSGKIISMFSVKLIPVRVLNETKRPSWILLLALLGLGAPLAIYLGYVGLGVWLRRAKRPVEAEAPVKEEEGPIPNALIEACLNGDCVLWTGSGLGAQAGLPTWSSFLAECRASLGEIEGRPERIAAKPDLPDYLRRRFSIATELPQAHRLIKQLEFPTLITTSLDNLLERAFPHLGGRVYTARDCDGLLLAVRRREVFLLKPFGDLDAPETICFGPAQCNETMQQHPATSELLENLLHSRVFLFLGASLVGLEQDLARISILEPASRRHFVLVTDAGEGWKPLAESLKRRYGIETLPFTASSPAHPEVVEFLTALIAAIQQKTASAEYYVTGEGS